MLSNCRRQGAREAIAPRPASYGDFAKLVVKAPNAKTVEERAALYAELLVTCGGCHRAINESGSK